MSKFVVVQTQHPQVDQRGERAVGDEGEEVVVQVDACLEWKKRSTRVSLWRDYGSLFEFAQICHL